jgi:phosphatidylserine decarboxylase
MLAKGTPAFMVIPPVLPVLLLAAMAMGWVPMQWWSLLALVVLALLAAVGVMFFRDPERSVAEGLVAPVHGTVLGVDVADGRTRVSTFMSPFDVHVVRAPLQGRVVSMERSGSGFHRADSPDAGHNVQLEIGLQGEEEPFTVVMITGWFARRIVPYVSLGDEVVRGSRMGLIRFGSRVDVLVPEGSYDISVREGTKVKAASTSLGVRP